MTRQPPSNNPVATSLEELKRRLESAQPVVVQSSGKLFAPQDPAIVNTPPDQKTHVKPSRWF
jgi:hypothetical protein